MKNKITFLLFIFFISISVNAQTRKWETIAHSTDGCHNQIRVKLERRVRLYDENVYEVRATLTPSQTTFDVKVSIKGDKEGSWSRFVVPFNGGKIYEFSGEYSKTDSPSFELKDRAYIGLELKHLIGKERYAKCGEHSNEIFLRDKDKGNRISREKKKERIIEENKTATNDTIETNKQQNTDSNRNFGSNSNQNSNNTNSESSTPQSRLKEYQNQADIENNKIRQQQEIEKAYQDDVSNAISESIDSNGNINASSLINSLPTATTKTQAYSNLIMSGTAILGQILQSTPSQEEIRQQEIANRRVQLKDGIGRYDSNNNKTGHWTYFYINTTAPKSSGSYKSGRKNGIWEIYENQDFNWAMDKIMKEVVVFDNGEIKEKYKAGNANYSVTRETGVFFREQTFIQQKGNYIIKNGVKVEYGLWEYYNKNGVNKATGYFNLKGEKTGHWSYGYKNNSQDVPKPLKSYRRDSDEYYVNGKLDGIRNNYSYFNGTIQSKTKFKNGVKLWVDLYDDNGKFEKRVTFDKSVSDDYKKFEASHPRRDLEKVNNLFSDISSFKDLDVIDISSVEISEIPKSINSLTNLKELILSQNKLIELPKSVFEIQSISVLKITRNQLKTINSDIGNLLSLEYLDFRYNLITEIPTTIKKLKKLKSLFLNKNKLIELPTGIGNLSSLENFDIDNNKLTQLPTSIVNLSNLTGLTLSFNNLTSLPKGFGNYPKLEYLGLQNNQLEKLPQGFNKMDNILILNLEYNQLKVLPESFGDFPELKSLKLENNQLEELPENFGNMPKLSKLDLEDNNLIKLPKGFGSFPELTSLNLKNNQLEELPENFGNMPKLKLLILKGNNLKSLPSNFKNMIRLENLYLDKSVKKNSKKVLKELKKNNPDLEIHFE